ncbi:MAG: hypothetical protein NTW52_17205 [Planctomycetota bacterium]|nr:hypothetical protein [Planctomycetota bacterium]
MSQTTFDQSNQSILRTRAGTPEASKGQEVDGDFGQMCDTVCTAVKTYGSQHPTVLASAVFLVGFYMGWKIKPW